MKKSLLLPLSRWLKIVLAVLLAVFVACLVLFYKKSRDNMLQQEIESRSVLLETNVKNIDNSLGALESYLYEAFSDSNLAEIVRIETGGEEDEVFYAKQEIVSKLQTVLGWNEALYMLFFYSPESEDALFLDVGREGSVFTTKQLIQQAVCTYVDESIASKGYLSGGYLLLEIEEEGYLIRFYRIRNSYIGMCLGGDAVLEPLEDLTQSQESLAFLCDMDGAVLASTQDLISFVDTSQTARTIFFDGTTWLQLCYLSEEGDFYIGTWTELKYVSRQFSSTLLILTVFAVFIFVLTSLCVWLAQHFLLGPVLDMEKRMKRLSRGEWEILDVETSHIAELDSMISNFNEMVSEIKDLKIENYEKEIEAQKTYLQCLQLQVNPHFYLNVLNIIYSLAQMKDCDMIQEVTLRLVDYTHYMFRDPEKLVTIQQEMEYVESYMEIQKIRFSDRLEYDTCLSSEIEDILIPPFVVQNFVENSVKYASVPGKKCRISVSAGIRERGDEPFVEIIIRDNGEGYAPELIQQFEQGRVPKEEAGVHVGMLNVRQRLKLVYADKAGVVLENDKGAVTHVWIPLTWQEEEVCQE